MGLFTETGPSKMLEKQFSIRLQYKSSKGANPFADIELLHPSYKVTQDAAELFLRMMTELSNDVAVKD